MATVGETAGVSKRGKSTSFAKKLGLGASKRPVGGKQLRRAASKKKREGDQSRNAPAVMRMALVKKPCWGIEERH